MFFSTKLKAGLGVLCGRFSRCMTPRRSIPVPEPRCLVYLPYSPSRGKATQNLTGDADSVRCRRAVLEDYDGVVAIRRDVHGGLDYLPAIYRQMLQRKGCRAYVAEVDKEIVAFMVQHLGINGTHAAASGGRVKSGFQGCGIMDAIGRFAMSDFVKEYPKVESMTFVAEDSEEQEKRLERLPSSYRFRRKFFEYIATGLLDKTLTLLKEEDRAEGHVISAQDLFDKAGCHSNVRFRTSSNGLFLYGTPWNASTLNLDTVRKVSKTYPVFLNINKKEECVSLSTSTYHDSARGWVIDHLFVGDTQTYKSHLTRHVSESSKKMDGRDSRLNLKLQVPYEAEQEPLVKLISQLGLEIIKQIQWIDMEQPIRHFVS